MAFNEKRAMSVWARKAQAVQRFMGINITDLTFHGHTYHAFKSVTGICVTN
jgi:hypothetical protein